MGLDIGGAEGNAFAFDQIGDSVTGKILTLEEVQQTDMDTGELAFWNNNPAQPKMMFRVTLDTELKTDESDDGKRSVYLRGSRKPDSKSSLAAVLVAVRAATGGTELEPGATLTLTFSGEGVARQRGWNPPKQYEASYQRPALNLGEDQPAQQQPPQAAPAQGGLTPDQLAALKAAGIDPASVQTGP